MQKFIKSILFSFFVFVSTVYFGQKQIKNSSYTIKENLDFPFGTLVKLKVEIIDGASLKLKSLDGRYLIKIKEVNDVTIKEPFTIEFIDESGDFPTENFALYKKLYRKEVENSLSSDQIKKMQKNYVGKIFIVLGYESGQFIGIPKESDYVAKNVKTFQLIKQDVGFYFKNYIVIDSKLLD